jgi:hypothetical protein
MRSERQRATESCRSNWAFSGHLRVQYCERLPFVLDEGAALRPKAVVELELNFPEIPSSYGLVNEIRR